LKDKIGILNNSRGFFSKLFGRNDARKLISQELRNEVNKANIKNHYFSIKSIETTMQKVENIYSECQTKYKTLSSKLQGIDKDNVNRLFDNQIIKQYINLMVRMTELVAKALEDCHTGSEDTKLIQEIEEVGHQINSHHNTTMKTIIFNMDGFTIKQGQVGDCVLLSFLDCYIRRQIEKYGVFDLNEVYNI
jgi:hypothetical protein